MMGFLKGILHNRYKQSNADFLAWARKQNAALDAAEFVKIAAEPRPVADTYVPTNAISDMGLIQHPLVKYDAKGAVKL